MMSFCIFGSFCHPSIKFDHALLSYTIHPSFCHQVVHHSVMMDDGFTVWMGHALAHRMTSSRNAKCVHPMNFGRQSVHQSSSGARSGRPMPLYLAELWASLWAAIIFIHLAAWFSAFIQNLSSLVLLIGTYCCTPCWLIKQLDYLGFILAGVTMLVLGSVLVAELGTDVTTWMSIVQMMTPKRWRLACSSPWATSVPWCSLTPRRE